MANSVTEKFYVSYDDEEYNEMLKEFEELALYPVEDFYLTEEITRTTRGKKKDSGFKRTVNFTGGTIGAYDDITTIGGQGLASAWDIVTSILKSLRKLIKFIATWLVKIPEGIAKLIKFIARIPESIVAKIKGDLEIYITVGDLKTIRVNIMPSLEDAKDCIVKFSNDDSLLSKMQHSEINDNADKLSKGIATTYGAANVSNVASAAAGLNLAGSIAATGAVGAAVMAASTPQGKKVLNNMAWTDSSLMKHIKKVRKAIGGIRIERSIISLSADGNLAMYVANKTVITDPVFKYGGPPRTYLEILLSLTEELSVMNQIVVAATESVDHKLNNDPTKSNGRAWNEKKRAAISEMLAGMNDISKFIASFTKYATKDIKAIERAYRNAFE